MRPGTVHYMQPCVFTHDVCGCKLQQLQQQQVPKRHVHLDTVLPGLRV